MSDEPDQDVPDENPEPAIVAEDIAVQGPWGPVYGPLSLTVAAGGLTVLDCPAGSGRTALLMTLAGRMKPNAGTLTVFGERHVQRIFRASALAGVDEIDRVSESVTVHDVLAEQLRWASPWYRPVRRADAADLDRVCTPVFGDRALPALGDYVDELEELDRLLMRVALANLKHPPLLVVGDPDRLTRQADQDFLIERLAELGQRQTVLTATVNDVSAGAIHDRIPVAHTTHAELVSTQKEH